MVILFFKNLETIAKRNHLTIYSKGFYLRVQNGYLKKSVVRQKLEIRATEGSDISNFCLT